MDGQRHRCFATNLSRTGLYMERPLESFVRHSAEVQLEIPIPGDEGGPVWAKAEVVYDCFDSLFHGTAVRFKWVSEPDQVRLARWLGSALPAEAASLGFAAA